ncbi:hypothetical protein D5301_24015 [Stenotrophomonas sp. MH181796]|nr:hypothetical protein [Stenotrophomonas sp. MH181796]
MGSMSLRNHRERIFPSRQSEVLMHDWMLLEIRIDWAASSAVLIVLDERSLSRSIFFRGLREFSADRREHWGQAVQSMRPPGTIRQWMAEFV